MRTIAILPIKSLGAAKSRLSVLLGNGSRQALAQAMFQDTLAAVRHIHQIERVAVVTANRVAETAARHEGVDLIRDEPESGHSEAAQLGISHAIAAGFERVLLVPGDTPLLDPYEVGALLDRSAEDRIAVTIVPDRHMTGTNALVLSPPAAIVPSFGPGSRDRHAALAAEAGLTHRVDAVGSLLLDVDTPDDLDQLAVRLDERRGIATNTRGALRQLDRSRLRHSVTPRGRVVAEPAIQVQVQA